IRSSMRERSGTGALSGLSDGGMATSYLGGSGKKPVDASSYESYSFMKVTFKRRWLPCFVVCSPCSARLATTGGGGSSPCCASAFAGTANILTATRALMGIGGALIMPSTLSILTNVFPPEERGRAIGVWAGVSGLGIAIGPVVGGALLGHFWWGSVFLVNVPVVLVGLIAGRLIVPNSKDPSSPRVDPIGAMLSVAGLVALVYGIIEVPSYGWGNGRIL